MVSRGVKAKQEPRIRAHADATSPSRQRLRFLTGAVLVLPAYSCTAKRKRDCPRQSSSRDCPFFAAVIRKRRLFYSARKTGTDPSALEDSLRLGQSLFCLVLCEDLVTVSR
jgi:hypothetical protein